LLLQDNITLRKQTAPGE